MSRSHKKPIITDQQGGSTKKVKRDASRTIRKSQEVPSGGSYKKFFCSWSIRDWSFYCPTNKKAYRK